MATKEAQREYQRFWVAQRRAEYLIDKHCAVCGSTDRLEIDHIDPAQKLYNPTTLWSMSLTNPRRIAELAKCQVLCVEHHAIKTAAQKVRNHGRTMYNHGCRCDVCFTAQQQHNAQRYAPA